MRQLNPADIRRQVKGVNLFPAFVGIRVRGTYKKGDTFNYFQPSTLSLLLACAIPKACCYFPALVVNQNASLLPRFSRRLYFCYL